MYIVSDFFPVRSNNRPFTYRTQFQLHSRQCFSGPSAINPESTLLYCMSPYFTWQSNYSLIPVAFLEQRMQLKPVN